MSHRCYPYRECPPSPTVLFECHRSYRGGDSVARLLPRTCLPTDVSPACDGCPLHMMGVPSAATACWGPALPRQAWQPRGCGSRACQGHDGEIYLTLIIIWVYRTKISPGRVALRTPALADGWVSLPFPSQCLETLPATKYLRFILEISVCVTLGQPGFSVLWFRFW